MAAGCLRRGAAGMKNARPLFRREAGEFQLLEPGGGHRGNIAPVKDGLRSSSSRFAEPAVRLVMGELQGEQGEREAVEFRFNCPLIGHELTARQSCDRSPALSPRGGKGDGTKVTVDEIAQLRGAGRKC